MVALLKTLGWNHIGVISEDSSYSRSLAQNIRLLVQNSTMNLAYMRGQLLRTGNYNKSAVEKELCKEWDEILPVKTSRPDWWQPVKFRISMNEGPKALVLPLHLIQVKNVMHEIANYLKQTKKRVEDLIIFGVDSWSSKIKTPAKALDDAMTTQEAFDENVEFRDHMTHVTISNCSSPWLIEYIAKSKNCCYQYQNISINCKSNVVTNCSSGERISDALDSLHWRNAERVKLGLEIVQDSIHKLWTSNCSNSRGPCENFTIHGHDFLQVILKHKLFWNGTNSGRPVYYYYHFKNATWTKFGTFDASDGTARHHFDVHPRNLIDKNKYESITNAMGRCFPSCAEDAIKAGQYPIQGSEICCYTCSSACQTRQTPTYYIKLKEITPECINCVNDSHPNFIPDYRTNARSCIEGPSKKLCTITGTLPFIGVVLAILAFVVAASCSCIFVWKRNTAVMQSAGFCLITGTTVVVMLLSMCIVIDHLTRNDMDGDLQGGIWFVYSLLVCVLQNLEYIRCHNLYDRCGHCHTHDGQGHSWHIKRSDWTVVLLSALSVCVPPGVWLMYKTQVQYLPYHGSGNLSHSIGFLEVPAALNNSAAGLFFVVPLLLDFLIGCAIWNAYKKIKRRFRMEMINFLWSMVAFSTCFHIALVAVLASEFNDKKIKIEVWFRMKVTIVYCLLGLLCWVYLLPVIHIAFTALNKEATDDFVRQFIGHRTRGYIKDSQIDFDEQVIGQGNFSFIYKGIYHHHSKRNRHPDNVVLKFVKDTERRGGSRQDESTRIKDQLTAINKFHEEALILNHLGEGCKSIVQFYGILKRPKRSYMVFEYMAKGPLDKYLQSNKLEERVLFNICKTICNACHYLEIRYVLHRDIRADNILVDIRNGQLVPKLADFGLAKFTRHDRCHSCSPDSQFAFVNSAPECFRAGAQLSTKSDVWSFGGLIWQIYRKGLRPFQKYSRDDRVWRDFNQSELRPLIVDDRKTLLDDESDRLQHMRDRTPAHQHGQVAVIENAIRSSIPQDMLLLIKLCFQYQPEDRPDFKNLKVRFKSLKRNGFQTIATRTVSGSEWYENDQRNGLPVSSVNAIELSSILTNFDYGPMSLQGSGPIYSNAQIDGFDGTENKLENDAPGPSGLATTQRGPDYSVVRQHL